MPRAAPVQVLEQPEALDHRREGVPGWTRHGPSMRTVASARSASSWKNKVSNCCRRRASRSSSACAFACFSARCCRAPAQATRAPARAVSRALRPPKASPDWPSSEKAWSRSAGARVKVGGCGTCDATISRVQAMPATSHQAQSRTATARPAPRIHAGALADGRFRRSVGVMQGLPAFELRGAGSQLPKAADVLRAAAPELPRAARVLRRGAFELPEGVRMLLARRVRTFRRSSRAPRRRTRTARGSSLAARRRTRAAWAVRTLPGGEQRLRWRAGLGGEVDLELLDAHEGPGPTLRGRSVAANLAATDVRSSCDSTDYRFSPGCGRPANCIN